MSDLITRHAKRHAADGTLLRNIAVNLAALMEVLESVKMATCLVTIGPIIFLYPFVQRFFMKGIIVGAV